MWIDTKGGQVPPDGDPCIVEYDDGKYIGPVIYCSLPTAFGPPGWIGVNGRIENVKRYQFI